DARHPERDRFPLRPVPGIRHGAPGCAPECVSGTHEDIALVLHGSLKVDTRGSGRGSSAGASALRPSISRRCRSGPRGSKTARLHRQTMSDEVFSAILPGSGLRVVAALTTEVSREARRLHQAEAGSAALMSEALTAVTLLGALQKEKTKVSLQLECDGPV